MRIFIFIGMMLGVVGCSGVDKLGTIGGTSYYSVHGSHLDGPNFTALVTRRGKGKPKVRAVMSGPGLATVTLPAIFGAGGNAAAAFLFGKSLKREGYSSSVNASGGTNSSNSSSSAKAKSSSSSSSSGGSGGGGHNHGHGHKKHKHKHKP